jgi:hypothetical protein
MNTQIKNKFTTKRLKTRREDKKRGPEKKNR